MSICFHIYNQEPWLGVYDSDPIHFYFDQAVQAASPWLVLLKLLYSADPLKRRLKHVFWLEEVLDRTRGQKNNMCPTQITNHAVKIMQSP